MARGGGSFGSNYNRMAAQGAKLLEQQRKREEAARRREEREERRSRGSMMYGRSYNSTEEPTNASGSIDPRTGEGHATQSYADGTRVSWDTDGEGESATHWTDQNVGKKSPRRHTPPPHAKQGERSGSAVKGWAESKDSPSPVLIL